MRVTVVGGEPLVRAAVSDALREADHDVVEHGPTNRGVLVDLGLPPSSLSESLEDEERAHVANLLEGEGAYDRRVRLSVLHPSPESPFLLKRAHAAAESAHAEVPGEVVVLRHGIVLGSGIAEAFRRVVDRRRVVFVPGITHSRFEPILLRDLASYVVQAVEREHLAPAYDLGCGEMITGGLLVRGLGENLGHRRTILPAPAWTAPLFVRGLVSDDFPVRAVHAWLAALTPGLLPRSMKAWDDFDVRPTDLRFSLAEACGMSIPLRREEGDKRFSKWQPPKRHDVVFRGRPRR